MLINDTEMSKQILWIELKYVKNPNWRETEQLAIYKAWKSWIWDHQTQIHLVEGRRFELGTSVLQKSANLLHANFTSWTNNKWAETSFNLFESELVSWLTIKEVSQQ